MFLLVIVENKRKNPTCQPTTNKRRAVSQFQQIIITIIDVNKEREKYDRWRRNFTVERTGGKLVSMESFMEKESEQIYGT